jgi:hypothetical protein
LIGAPGVMDWTGTLMIFSLNIRGVFLKTLLFRKEG